MKYLVDTHVFIWWMEQNKKLKTEIKAILGDPENHIFLSIVTVWEIAIKKKIGKLKVPKSWKEDIRKSGFSILSISLEHIYSLDTIPLFHRDPFDQILIIQSKEEHLTLITSDEKIWKYKIDLLKV